MSYKVLYHQGDEIDLKTKVAVGRLQFDDGRLLIDGKEQISIPIDSLRTVDLFRMHGIGRMLKVQHDGGILFVSVIRFCLFGLFALVNFYGTGRLQTDLQNAIDLKSESSVISE